MKELIKKLLRENLEKTNQDFEYKGYLCKIPYLKHRDAYGCRVYESGNLNEYVMGIRGWTTLQKAKKHAKDYVDRLTENHHSREEQVDIVKNSSIGTVLPEEYIYHYIQKIHDYNDFIDGDLGQRIEGHEQYKLMEIPIDKIELNYEMDNDLANEYGQKILKTNYYPSVVLDNDYDVIDGTHRIGGLISIGVKTVKAWVGI